MIERLLFLACAWTPGDVVVATDAATTEAAKPLVFETDGGPVRASVTVSPAEPALGDAITVVLSVDAQPNITLEMPPFGEALGRFSIADFSPSEKAKDDGGKHAEQRYTLQAPMSGRQRLPAFRVAFTGADGAEHELLTDEIPLRIGSVVDPGDDALRAERGSLPTIEPPNVPVWAWGVGGGAVVALSSGIWLLRRKKAPSPLSAWDQATRRLERLAASGIPENEAVEAYYVELSDIVRRYVEDRFGLRAPESTTEEFLQEARRSGVIGADHRQGLEAFLAESDRVKFARHTPGPDACRQALETARRFVEDTRPREREGKAA